MLKLLQSIVNSIISFINFVINTINSMISLFSKIPDYLTLISTSITQLLPGYIAVFASAYIAIQIVKYIIGRSNTD